MGMLDGSAGSQVMVDGLSRDGGLPEGIREGVVLAGKYRIGATLGAGAMGVVVSAHHLLLKEDVAIKFLVAHRWDHADAVERFVQEARAAIRIESKHVVRVLDVAVLESGAPYIVMELLQGRDLAARLRAGGSVPANEAVEFLLQACDAIGASHRLGIVHRDIKPANLFLVERAGVPPIVKVLDFGISKSTRLVPITADVDGTPEGAQITGPRAILGSPFYMSPEQMESARDVDARTDIWALGVTLFELVTGAPPFRGSSLVQVYSRMLSKDGADAWRAELAKVAPALVEVVERCLAHDPDERFATAEELAGSLATFASKGPSALPRLPPSGLSDSNSGVERAPASLPRRRDSGRPSGGRSLLVAVLGGFVGSAIFVLCARAKSGVDVVRATEPQAAATAPSAFMAPVSSAVPAESPVPASSSARAASSVKGGSVEAMATSGSSMQRRAPTPRVDAGAPLSPSASTAAAAPAMTDQAIAPRPASSFSPQQVSDLLRSRE
jgi:serine/threonine-protein kinase